MAPQTCDIGMGDSLSRKQRKAIILTNAIHNTFLVSLLTVKL